MAQLWTLVLLVSFLAARACASDYDPILNMCSRWSHQSVVKANTLLIYGGIETYNTTAGKGGTQVIGINPYLITVDMSTTWDWKTPSFLSNTIQALPRPSSGSLPPSLMRGALYQGSPSDPRVYLYGGTVYTGNLSSPDYTAPDSQPGLLWSYDTAAQTWESHDISGQSPARPNHGASADAPGLGLGFWLNGQLDYGTAANMGITPNKTVQVPGMLIAQLDGNDTKAYNVSNGNLGTAVRIGGGFTYVDGIGGKGVVVSLGGLVGEVQTDSSISGDPKKLDGPDGGAFIDFGSVDVYDVASFLDHPAAGGVWYNQKATGNIPPSRIDFCLVNIAAPDNSSHNIYLYGGVDPISNVMYDDMYVLSLPSFTWTQVYTGNSPRWGHTCHIVGNRQLLTVGGSLNTTANGCDWEDRGVGIMDLSSLEWGSVYNASAAPYVLPNKVVANIGGVPSGSATLTATFSQTGLASVFGARSSTSTGNAISPPQPSSSHLSTVAIAGIATGGVVGLILLLALVLLCLHRRKQQRVAASQQLLYTPSTTAGGTATPASELDGRTVGFAHNGYLSAKEELDALDGARHELYASSGPAAFAAELEAQERPREMPAANVQSRDGPPVFVSEYREGWKGREWGGDGGWI